MCSHPQRGCPEDGGRDIGVGLVTHDVLPSGLRLDYDLLWQPEPGGCPHPHLTRLTTKAIQT